jgi:E3 ubiquitin-protein ligase HUWE1
LTQDFVLASDFASFGGVKMLLKLNQVSGFSGFESLATLLIRHILEDPATLKHTIEKVIRASTVSSNSYTTKELHYLLLRVLAPAACRSPSMFAEVARDILRVDITLLKRGEPEEDHRLLVKSLPMKTSAHTSSSNSHQTMTSSVIRDLLNYLVLPQFDSLPDSQRQNIIEVDPAVIAAAGSSSNDAPQVARHQITESAALRQSNSSSEVNIPTGVSATNTANKETKKKDLDKCKSNMDEDENLKKKPLISKSSICRLLAELVKSYGNCAKQITDHVYEAGSSEMIKEDTSALAFLLDELLICKYDKDSAQHVKTLIAALASCNHYPDAQTALVSEMKTGMARALIWPEGNIKHMRIQALAGLICTMIDSCPTSQSAQQTNMPPYKQQQQNMNNMVKMMLKRGLITDLARVSHSLDLSSPNVATTINAVLKPLETLSRIVNQPTSVLSTSANKPKPRNGPISNNATEEGSTNSREENEAGQGESTSERIDPENESSPNQDVQNDTNNANNGTNTTNSEATRAQGNEDGGGPDAEATENDISTAAESIDANSESQLQTVEEGDAEEFEEMMDHILERDSSDSRDVAAVVRAGTEQVIMAGLAEVIDQQPDSFLQDDVTHHDSQVIKLTELMGARQL